MSARERIDALFDAGTFRKSACTPNTTPCTSAWKAKNCPADGVITGSGYLGNKQIAAFCQDFSVQAGSLGKMQAGRSPASCATPSRSAFPVVAFKDSGGARIQEGVDALSGYGDVFYANVLLSGVVPRSPSSAAPAPAVPPTRPR